LAGSNLSHFADARGEAARFSYPGGINRLPDGSLAVADCKNNCVRRVGADGTVSTLAGQCSFLTKNAGQFADGPVGSALFYCPSDVFPAPDGSLVVVDQGNARIRRVAGGQVTTLAGVGPVEVREGEGQIGFLDGPAEEARFNDPQAVLVDGKGVIYISESFNCRIRKLEPAKGKAGEVSTLAGESSDTNFGIGGWIDGPGKTAKLNYPHGMAFDEKGNFIVADAGNAVIRLVTPAGQVRTLYGKPGELKFNDGPIDQATFQAPVDVAPGPNGSLFVIDGAANRLRWIVP
jgi:DNA-binding beta-propeller fold protein YncE